MNRLPYIVWTPPYQHTCGGNKALHRLAHLLNEKGFDAYVTAEGNPEWNERRCEPLKGYDAYVTAEGNTEWNERRCEPLPDSVDPRIIAVYPEIVFGNPFRIRNRVRWVLNVPGFLGGPDRYEPEELVFVWSKGFLNLPQDRILTVKTLEDELFNEENVVERDADRFWIGKGRNKGIPLSPITEGMEEVTYAWPPERKELAGLFKRTRTFYTYDDCTQLSWEALLCGCKVILLPQNKELTLVDVAPSDDYDSQLENFIKITQEWANGMSLAPAAFSASESPGGGEPSQSDAGIRFVSGFYHDEGGCRWMSREGAILVPAGPLASPASLRFALTCSRAGHYDAFPFDVQVHVGNEQPRTVTFDRSEQTQTVALDLAPGAESRIRLVSSQTFSPYLLGVNFDRRVLSVNLSGLTSTSEASTGLDASLSRAAADAAGDPAGAETILHRCLRQHPNAPEPYRQMALLLASRQDYPQAKHMLRRALALAPADAALHNEHGTLSLLLGDLPGAVGAYQRALELDPSLEAARANLAACEAYLPRGPQEG